MHSAAACKSRFSNSENTQSYFRAPFPKRREPTQVIRTNKVRPIRTPGTAAAPSSKEEPFSNGRPLGCIPKNGQTTRAGIAYGSRKNQLFSAPIVESSKFAPTDKIRAGKYPIKLVSSITNGICHTKVSANSCSQSSRSGEILPCLLQILPLLLPAITEGLPPKQGESKP